MSVYTSQRRRKSRQECQLNWKIKFWASYRAQLPTAFAAGGVIAAVATYALQPHLSASSAFAVGVAVLAATPLVVLGTTLAGMDPYPTAAQHVKTDQVIDMHAERKRQELAGAGAAHRIPRA